MHNYKNVIEIVRVICISDGDPVQPCFLVVINPSSGRKQGVNKYRQDVQPFFEIAGVTVVEELVTGLLLCLNTFPLSHRGTVFRNTII